MSLYTLFAGVIFQRRIKSGRQMGITPSMTFNSLRSFFASHQIRNTAPRHVSFLGKTYDARLIFDNKLYFNGVLRAAGFPATRDLAILRISGATYEFRPLDHYVSLGELLAAEAVAFAKLIAGTDGRGASVLSANGVPDLADGTYLLQSMLKQDGFMHELNPSSINTLRIVTVDGQQPRVFQAVLRIGRPGNPVDNWSSGGCVVNIDVSSGEVVSDFVRRYPFGRHETHPDMGYQLRGQHIPHFEEAAQLVADAHGTLFPFMPSIGWDVAITPDGPVIVEANHNWEANFHRVFDSNFESKLLAILTTTQA